jgi:hypothetical protein
MCLFIMSTKLWTSLLLLTHLTSSTILTQQSWHETLLLTVTLQTSLDGMRQYAMPTFYDKQTEQRAPWAHPVICTDTILSINSPLCIYTSTTFASGRGISIFTTPSIATKFASLAAFSYPNALKKDYVNTPTGTYRTQKITGKGIGIVASKDLGFGDRVTAHTPAFIAYLEGELGTVEREGWWREAVERLPEGLRREFLGLCGIYGDERVK